MSGTGETPEEAVEAVESAMERQGRHDERVDEAIHDTVGRFPGQKLNRRLEAAWTNEAELPAEEAEQSARTAAGVAEAADADRAAVDVEVHELDVNQPGTALDVEAHSIAAEVEKLATDAETEGFAVGQDALNARAGQKAHLDQVTQAAEDRAQADLGQASRDLAEEEALKAELDADARAGRAGAAPNPLPPPPPA